LSFFLGIDLGFSTIRAFVMDEVVGVPTKLIFKKEIEGYSSDHERRRTIESASAITESILRTAAARLNQRVSDCAGVCIACSPPQFHDGWTEQFEGAVKTSFSSVGISPTLRIISTPISAHCALAHQYALAATQCTLIIDLAELETRCTICVQEPSSPVQIKQQFTLPAGSKSMDKIIATQRLQLAKAIKESQHPYSFDISGDSCVAKLRSLYPDYKVMKGLASEFAQYIGRRLSSCLAPIRIRVNHIILTGGGSLLKYGFRNALIEEIRNTSEQLKAAAFQNNSILLTGNLDEAPAMGALYLAINPLPVLPRVGSDIAVRLHIKDKLEEILLISSSEPVGTNRAFSLMDAIQRKYPEYSHSELRLDSDEIQNHTLTFYSFCATTGEIESTVFLDGDIMPVPDTANCPDWKVRPFSFDVRLEIKSSRAVNVQLWNINLDQPVAHGKLHLFNETKHSTQGAKDTP